MSVWNYFNEINSRIPDGQQKIKARKSLAKCENPAEAVILIARKIESDHRNYEIGFGSPNSHPKASFSLLIENDKKTLGALSVIKEDGKLKYIDYDNNYDLITRPLPTDVNEAVKLVFRKDHDKTGEDKT